MEAHSVPRAAPVVPRSRHILAAFGDERLVEQVRRGNDAAFEAIYDRHHRPILSFCRHMLASVEEAEDAVQHTFIQAHAAMRRGERELKLKPWLYTIARNRCLSILRARREQAAELDDIPTAGLSEEVQQRADLRDLLADIRGLPDEQRAALVLSEVGDLSHPEIAAVVGCEARKVKSLVFQARSSLMESRNAREIPCHEIRQQLATASGGELRRAPLRRHLKQCEGCSAFRADVSRQRKAMAAILPVVPSVALKHSALAAVGIGGGGAATGGGLASLLGSTGIGKAIAVLAVAGVAVGGGELIHSQVSGADPLHGRPPVHAAAPAAPAAARATHPTAAAAQHHAAHAARRRAAKAARSHAPQRAAAHHHPGHAGRHHGRHHQTASAAPGYSVTAPAQGGTVKQNHGRHLGAVKGHRHGGTGGRPASPGRSNAAPGHTGTAPGRLNNPHPAPNPHAGASHPVPPGHLNPHAPGK